VKAYDAVIEEEEFGAERAAPTAVPAQIVYADPPARKAIEWLSLALSAAGVILASMALSRAARAERRNFQ
jgi:hypothetical protein